MINIKEKLKNKSEKFTQLEVEFNWKVKTSICLIRKNEVVRDGIYLFRKSLIVNYLSMYIINPEQCHVINATYFKKKSTSMPHILDFAMSL